MPMKIIRDDITKVSADVIVNTANPMPTYTTGTDKAVYEAAGAEQLLVERQKIGEIARGDIAVTPAFALKAKYIIHAVGPWWEGGNNGEFDILRSCYQKSLEKTVELGCQSIAIPLIAAGGNRFPKPEALQIALEVINRFLMEQDLEVYLVVFDKKAFELSGKVFQEIQSYIDQNYVDDHRKAEYPQKDEAAMMEMDEGSYFQGVTTAAGLNLLPAQNIVGILGRLTKEKLLKRKEESFQDCLLRLMREKNLDPPDVYKAANLDRRMFSKLISDKNANPKKKTVIAIALALRLDVPQSSDLLGRAGYALATNNEFDLVIRWCIENKYYNIIRDVNPILFEYNLPELGSSARD